MYQRGHCIERSEQAAYLLFQKAAGQGYQDAIEALNNEEFDKYKVDNKRLTPVNSETGLPLSPFAFSNETYFSYDDL